MCCAVTHIGGISQSKLILRIISPTFGCPILQNCTTMSKTGSDIYCLVITQQDCGWDRIGSSRTVTLNPLVSLTPTLDLSSVKQSAGVVLPCRNLHCIPAKVDCRHLVSQCGCRNTDLSGVSSSQLIFRISSPTLHRGIIQHCTCVVNSYTDLNCRFIIPKINECEVLTHFISPISYLCCVSNS